MLVKVRLCAYRFFSVVCHVKYYEKKHVKVFSLERLPLFKNLRFHQPPGSKKNALISSTVIVRIAFEPLKIINGGLSHSIMREKIGQNLLPREDSLFLKNLVLDLLGPKKMIKSLAQYLSNYHVCPYELFPYICHVRYHEKITPQFCSPEKLAFFQKLVFSITPWLLQKWYYTFHSNCQNICCTLTKCPLRFGTLDIANEKAKVFCHREDSFYWKVCF